MPTARNFLALVSLPWLLFAAVPGRAPSDPQPTPSTVGAVPATQDGREIGAPRGEGDFAALRSRAEERYAEGSYALAHRLYEEAGSLELDQEEEAWVAFRLADTRWRSAAATNDPDATELERASAALQELVAAPERPEERGRVWAEAQESLGDFYWDQRRFQNWSAAWAYYQPALEFWAASSDLELARKRYLDIVFTAAQPRWHQPSWGHGSYGYLSTEILENAVEIAVEPEDVARARFLLGAHYTNQGQNIQYRGRAERELQAVLELGKENPWYDDALYKLGTFLENYGRAERGENGQWTWKQDFVGAVALYRRLMREHHQGETRYYDDVRTRIQRITEPTLMAAADQFFLPGSEIGYRLNWRNLKRIELALYRVDLTRDVGFQDRRPGQWLDSLRLETLETERSWTFETEDDGSHRPDNRRLALEEKLEPGAWVLRATGGGKEARALLLVSDVALTSKATGESLLAWLTDVRTGEPVAGADLRLWQRYYDGGSHRWREARGETAADGTKLFDLGHTTSGVEFFLSAAADGGARQAYVQSNAGASRSPQDTWRIYAFTDRSTYRPLDEVQWKLLARRYDGDLYSTPANAELEWEIRDPSGAVVEKGKGQLNAFGATHGKLATDEVMLLGEYRVQFHHQGKSGRQYLGESPLFRLEEYKLPEFEVKVVVPEEDGRTRLFQVGDQVEVDVDATYYFGGPVAEANVEVFVFQRPHYHTWKKEREFPWFYEEPYTHWWGGQGQQIARLTLKTDREGRARVVFDTPPDVNGDFEYTIEARVVDASRREISGTGEVVVTQREYYAHVEVAHAIHRPGADVELSFKTLDPNGNPVQAEGQVTVTRRRWIEVWRDPTGRRVAGSELDRLRSGGPFPPPEELGWQIDYRGYEAEEVARTTLTTGAGGEASWEFTPETDGYYEVSWTSVDSRGGDVVANTTLFVADEATRELGYLPGGIEILVDRDTVEVGDETAVMLAAPASGRWILFTVEGEELYHFEVVRLEGTVKLLRLPITETHVPNVYLGAISLAGAQPFEHRVELVVPPVSRFLDVEVAHDAESYLPGQEGEVAVTVRDRAGDPVTADLSVAVVDDALSYIQGDYAGDPRRFFYGQKRSLLVQTRGSVHHAWYRRLARNEDGELYEASDDRDGSFFGKEEKRGRQDFRQSSAQDALRNLEYSGNAPMEMMEAEGLAMMDSAAGPSAPASKAAGGRMRGPGGGGAGAVQVRVRSDFRDTALWAPTVTTDEEGHARVTVPFPDSTTRWRTTVRAADTGSRFGAGEATVRTRQPLIARLQSPRFFLVGDEVTVSGNLNNNTDRRMTVSAGLEVEGLEVLGRLVNGELVAASADSVQVPASGQTRVDWRVRVSTPGEAVLRLSAVGEELGDAVERRLKVYPHGIEALVAKAGKFTGDELAFSLDLPAERGADSTRLRVQVTPSLAVTMLDALPYLIDYPYGCVEQTLSRFMPSVVVTRTLRDLGLSAENAMERVFGGIEGEFVSKTHPKGKQALDELDAMVERGLERLYDFQHSDGGWGWWKTDSSDHFMTAYVLWGLSQARDAGVEVRPGVLENAARWLAAELVEEEERTDMQAWMLHALAVYGGGTGDSRSAEWIRRASDNLWAKRDRLNAYTRALFALAAHGLGDAERARVLVDNLVNGVDVDETPDTSIVQVGGGRSEDFVQTTAHWGKDGIHHRWSESGVEATAFALRALVAIDPDHELVGPVTNWLVKNRRGAQWSNTRDTAITVLALNDYLVSSGELATDVAFELLVNGESVGARSLTAAELLSAPTSFEIAPELIRSGANEVRIVKTRGEGALYFAAHATFFSQEEPIPARGNELYVRREYYRLVGRPTLLAGHVYDRQRIEDGATVESGDRIEVVLTVEAKNDLEYLVFEDLKPAGFEAVQVRSGAPLAARQLERGEAEARFAAEEGDRRRAGDARQAYDLRLHDPGYTGETRSVHQELRDRKVAMFVSRLSDGFWELRYDLRAEVPGSFHALPVLGHAMYVPEIRANGSEIRLSVVDG